MGQAQFNSKKEVSGQYLSNNFIDLNNCDPFIEKTNIILNEYLSTSDRLSVLIYSDKYQVVVNSKLMEKSSINESTRYDKYSKLR